MSMQGWRLGAVAVCVGAAIAGCGGTSGGGSVAPSAAATAATAGSGGGAGAGGTATTAPTTVPTTVATTTRNSTVSTLRMSPAVVGKAGPAADQTSRHTAVQCRAHLEGPGTTTPRPRRSGDGASSEVVLRT